MASILTCLVTSATWCCCTATMSLASSCCGNDKASNIPPSATSGRKRSVLLLLLTIGISFAFQYAVGPYIMELPISNYVTDAWTDGCMGFNGNEELQKKCVGNRGVYRATGSALLFFLLAGLAAVCKPTANREAWPAKYVLFLFLVLGTCFIPNEPLFSDIYLQIARIGAVIFVVIQQVIILDMAYNWNDSWVEKANQAEDDGKKWLGAILASCAILFVGALAGIGLLFAYFSGCASNTAFIVITLIAMIVLTALQLSGDEASLLASATVGSYGTYLCYTAVSKNPDSTCNPFMGDQDILGIILGIGITLMSLAWTGYSYTAESRINGKDSEETLVESKSDDDDGGERKVQGVVVSSEDPNNNYGSTTADEEQPSSAAEETTPSSTPPKPVSWKLNIILAMISCWIAMALTGWGSIEAGGNAANPDVSRVSMWMLIASQWIMYLFYGWSLAAPRLFPDRDFS